MRKATSELVTMFWDGDQPVGILYENGKREIYKMERASKLDVIEILEVNTGEVTSAH